MEYFKELVARANLGTWDSWSMQYRVLAVIVALLLAYVVLRAILPVALRLLRPVLFLALVLIAVWVLYPSETCSIEFLSKLLILCAR